MRSLYIHVPFCARRCSYCDFAIAVRRTVPVEEFLTAVRRELCLRFAGRPLQLDTVYLGGGTPSRLGAAGIERLLDLVRGAAKLNPGAEVTIEVNPEDVSAMAVKNWLMSGVNRLSLGAQSFDDRVLAWMHRGHQSNTTERAVETIRAAGLTNLSLDLIFAVPESLERNWARDLDRALALDPEHLSLYGLTVEPGTPLGRWSARGAVAEAPDEVYAGEFMRAHAEARAAGFDHYEVSNFARRGFRARHNSAYWTGAPYAGVGPGAHEYDGNTRRWNQDGYTAWLRALAEGLDPVAGAETLTAENRLAEAVYLGLRTDAGLAVGEGEGELVARWVQAGWAVVTATGTLVLTAAGWLRLDAIAAALTNFRSRS